MQKLTLKFLLHRLSANDAGATARGNRPESCRLSRRKWGSAEPGIPPSIGAAAGGPGLVGDKGIQASQNFKIKGTIVVNGQEKGQYTWVALALM